MVPMGGPYVGQVVRQVEGIATGCAGAVVRDTYEVFRQRKRREIFLAIAVYHYHNQPVDGHYMEFGCHSGRDCAWPGTRSTSCTTAATSASTHSRGCLRWGRTTRCRSGRREGWPQPSKSSAGAGAGPRDPT